MSKNLLQDVLTKGERGIRQVPLPPSRLKEREFENGIRYEREIPEPPEGAESGWPRKILWLAVALFLILPVAILAFGFRKAVLTVAPHSAPITVNNEFVAAKSGGDNVLPFQTASLVRDEKTVIPADIEKRVSEKASGAIVIYNGFSQEPQRLIKNTRFETPDGLIYRIPKSVVVPGKRANGKETIPGTVEATVFADSPGEEYNGPPTDFTIPGFKSDPARFAAFYARSKTPLSGGQDGIILTPSEAAELSARETLRAKLRENVRAEMQSHLPEGFVLFADAISLSFESLPLTQSGNGNVVIGEKLSAIAYLFPKKELASAIVKQTLPSYDGSPVEIPALATLAFAFSKDAAPSGESDALRFTLTGAAKVVWTFDEQALRSALAGKQKSELAAALSAFPAVERAEVMFRPFWSSRFPENPARVEIKRENVPQ